MTAQTPISVAVERPDSHALSAEAQAFLDQAEAFEITDNDSNAQGVEIRKAIKDREKDLDARRKSITKPLDEAKRQVMDLFRPALEVLKRGDTVLGRKLIAYHAQQEALRRKEELRLREEARKQEEKLRRQAEAARQKGKEEKAEALEQQADFAPTPTVAAAPPPKGLSFRTEWDFKITDKAAVPEEYKEVNEVKIRGVVRALKENARIPGVRVFKKDVPVQR